MRTIWKVELSPDPAGRCWVEVPVGAHPLSVGVQEDKIVAWLLVDPTVAKRRVHFLVYGTGHPVHVSYAQNYFVGTVQNYFVGTVQLRNGLVFHFFYDPAQVTG